MTCKQHTVFQWLYYNFFLMTTNKKLRQMSSITSVTFLSGILLTSTIMMMIPSVEAYDPQPQIWFSSKNSKDLGTFLKYEKYEGYSWEGKINVMIYAPGWNEDPQKMDTIGTGTDTPIGVIVRNNVAGSSGAVKSLEPCGFLETGPDTGLFYGRVKLSGTDLDVNGDGVGEMGFGKSSCANLSEGTSKSSHREAAKLESSQSGALTVWWQYNEDDDQVIAKSATYSMTEAEIDKIVQKSIKKWDLTGVTVIHRVGKLFVSDQIVFVGVSSMHRQNAFDACNFIMDWLKTKAPFWKVEENNNHRIWVSSRQSDQEATKKWKS